MPKEFLEMRNVVKVYGGIKALNNVDLVLKKASFSASWAKTAQESQP